MVEFTIPADFRMWKFVASLFFLGGAAAAPSHALECLDIDDLEHILKSGNVLLLGELHGTAESPAFLAGVVCQAIQAGKPVSVLLEIPVEEAARVAAFLDSKGKRADKIDLLTGDFWHVQDGRSSKAMVALLDTLREWRRSGHALRVALFDSEEPSSSSAREKVMAELFHKAILSSPDDFFVALMGNFHNRLTPMELPTGEILRPMAQILASIAPGLRITSLNWRVSGGTAWYCSPECGVKNLRPRAEGDAPRIVLENQESGQPYHGVFHIGKVKVSLPAVEASRGHHSG